MIAEIPEIVLLVDADRHSLEAYSRQFEDAGLWVAAMTSYDELVPSAEELHPDVIIADADPVDDADVRQALDAMKQHPELGRIPLIVLATPRAGVAPCADVTLRKPVPPEFLLRRTREILAHSRELRGRSNEIVKRSHNLLERSERLTGAAALRTETEAVPHACPTCATTLDWVERGTIGGVCYDYFRWCPKGCGLFCYNRDAKRWIKLA